jgi:NUMOD4 motif
MSTDLALAPAPTWLPEPGGGRWVVAARPEFWRPVPDWEGWYEASDQGRARSMDRIVARRDGRLLQISGKILTPWLRGCYPSVTLARPGGQVTVYVHSLVLAAFDRAPLPGEEARHGPRGPAFNWWPEDLCWGTSAENTADMERDGTMARGERNGQARLTVAGVLDIRARRLAGETHAAIAAACGVSEGTVYDVIHRRSWAHVA